MVPDLIMDQMIQENAESPDAYLSRASFRYGRKDDPERREKAIADVNKAIELDPESERLTLAAAQLYVETKDSAKAQALLESGVSRLESGDDKLEPGTAKYVWARNMYTMLATIAEEQDDLERSKKYVDQGLKHLELDPELMFLRANLEIDLTKIDPQKYKIDSAKETLARLEQQLGPRAHSLPLLEILRARLLMVDSKFAAAARLLEKQRSLLSRSGGAGRYLADIYRYLVTCYQRTGQYSLARQYQKLLGNTVNAEFADASALLRKGSFTEAIELFQKLSQEESLTPEGRQAIFNGMLDANIGQQLRLPKEQRDWTEVDRLAGLYLDRPSLTQTEKEVFRIRLLARKGESSEARAQAERLVLQNPGNMNFLMLQQGLQTDPGIAMNILKQMRQRFGDSVPVRLALAQRILQMGGDEVSARLEELGQNADRFTFEDQAQLWQGLAQAYATAELYDKAIETIRHLLEPGNENTNFVNAISLWAYQSGNLPVMEEMLAIQERLTGKESSQWQIADGRHLLWLFKQGQRDRSTLNEVRHRIDQCLKQQPNSSTAYALQAELCLLEENDEGAIEALKTAYENDPRNADYKRRLVDLLVTRGLSRDASFLLSRFDDAEKRPIDRMREIYFLAQSDPAAALEKAIKLVPPDCQDFQRLDLLADIQQLAGKPDEALATRKRAVQAQPDLNMAWLKYVQLLIQQGKRDEAEAAVAQLQTQVAQENLPQLLGQCQAMLGNLDQAQQIYDNAIQAQPNNTSLLRDAFALASAQKNQARVNQLLDQIIALDRPDADPTTAANVIWARRTKAQILASTGSYKDFQAALQLLEQNAGGEQQLEGTDLLLWLTYCSSRPEAASRQRAVARLRSIQDRRRLADSEKAVLAGLYKSSGRWNDAQRLMLDLLTAQPDNQNLISTYSQWLLERDELTEAAAWIRKLDPATFGAIRFTALLQVRQGKSRDAATRLLALVPKDLTAEHAGDVQNIAAICEALGQYDPNFYTLAEQQWLRYAKLRPDDTTSLIGFYMRVPKGEKLDKCFTLCERQMTKAFQDQKPELIVGYLGIGLDALNNHKRDLPADSPLFDRVSKWFAVARKANVGELDLTAKEMYFYNIRSDFPKLEQLYRAFLNRNDVSDLQKATVRNNLAYLLAVTDRGTEAQQVIGDAIQQLGPRAALLDTRAMAYLSSGQLDLAIKDLQTIVAGGEATPGMYFHLALAEQKNNNLAAAVEAFRKAQSMGLTEADLEPPEVPMYRRLLTDLGPELEKQQSDLELSSR